MVERLDGFARITSKEFAISHFVKNGTLQNACSTRPRVVVGLGKSAHSHIGRLMNSRQKGLKRMMTKVQWLCWGREIVKKENLSPDGCHDRSGKFDKRGDQKLGQNSSKRQFSDARQLGCVFQDMTPPKSILRKGTGHAEANPTCEIHARLLHVIPKFETKIPRSDYISPGEPHERSHNAPKFEDRSQEETEWQEQGAREAAWKLAQNVLEYERSMKEQHSSHLRKIGACLHQF